MAKGEELKTHIEALRNSIPELKGVLLASNEGFPIAHSLSSGVEANRLAAIAAAASGLSQRISQGVSTGAFADASIQTDQGALFLYPAGVKAVLVVSGPSGGNTGLIHIEARAVAEVIGNLL